MKKRSLLLILPAGLALALLFSLPSCSNNNTATAPVTVTQAPVTIFATPLAGVGSVWHQALADTASPSSTQFSERTQTSLTTFNGAMWVIGGGHVANLNDVWSSTNGVSWTNILADNAAPPSTQFSQRSGAGVVVFNPSTGSASDGKIWVIGGNGGGAKNDVWNSSNGVTWTNLLTNNGAPPSTQFPQRYAFGCVAYQGALWIIGGFAGSQVNDVWKSTDGVTWTNVLADTASPSATQFSQRRFLGALVYNGAMWVIGGQNGSSYFNDVWNSTDGITWTKVLADTASPSSSQFPQRSGHSVAAFNGAMWLMGGSNGSFMDDVWTSTDGAHWTQVALSAAFNIRTASAMAVFNNELWLTAGFNGAYLNDVWYSP